MVTTELGACEWFVWDVRRSNLLDRGQLDEIIGEFLQAHPGAEPPALAEYLVDKGVLTAFQAERLLAGKTQGFVMGPFTLSDALGSGSMGTVYKAQSKTDEKWYAVKVLPRRSMWNVRIARRKVRAFENIKHPSVIPFVDVGTTGGMHYLAWPYVEGQPFEKVIKEYGKLNPSLAAHYGLQIAEGLEASHQQGLFHGLVKPSNLIVGSQNDVFILDFGIGCLLAETEGESLVDTMSTANAIASGLDCSSPESIMDPTNLTPAGDQYSLGCTLYYALTGQYPFPDGSAAEKMMAHQFREPTPIKDLNPDVPDELAAVVERLMKKAPDARFGNCAEVADALRPLARKPEGVAKKVVNLKKSTPPVNKAEAPKAEAPPAPARKSSVVSPSAPTPVPNPAKVLPTRSSFKVQKAKAPVKEPVAKEPPAKAAPPKAIPVQEPKHEVEESEERVVPGLVAGGRNSTSLEERLGPVGIVIAAILACGLVWLLAVALKLI